MTDERINYFLLTHNDQTKNILAMDDDWKLNVDL